MHLSARDRGEALAIAADASGRPAGLLEKDVWVVWSLGALFESEFAGDLCFKGGTSLSKAHKVIARFSEDIDVTYDIRALLADVIGDASGHALPPNRSQARRWTDIARARLAAWTTESALPAIVAKRETDGAPARIQADGDCLFVQYRPIADLDAYVEPNIKIEFGGRATTDPAQEMAVTCDAAPFLPALSFPTANPRVLDAERTFWEKVTAAHVYCHDGRLRAERFARHWYDIVRLDETGVAERALRNREIGRSVARHKEWFFAAKDAAGSRIDYMLEINGRLRLVPLGNAREALGVDYERMLDGGLLEVGAATFDQLMQSCSDLEERANAAVR